MRMQWPAHNLAQLCPQFNPLAFRCHNSVHLLRLTVHVLFNIYKQTPSRSPPNMACFLTLIGRFDNNPGSDSDWKPQIKAKCSTVQECNETRKSISLLFITLAPSAKYHPSVWEYGRICATLLVYSNTFEPLLTPREPFWCPL